LRASAADSYSQPFEPPLDATGASWRFTATGTDANGRPFTVPAVETTIAFPAVEPPPRAPAPDNIRVFGGRDYSVYLGCFNCDEFHTESIWNRFGSHGSPFSQTSINNQFSQYGSPFSSFSACNEFATQPPVLADSRTFYGELTLNSFRARAIRDTAVVAALRVLCSD
jgi:hypothetical protein